MIYSEYDYTNIVIFTFQDILLCFIYELESVK